MPVQTKCSQLRHQECVFSRKDKGDFDVRSLNNRPSQIIETISSRGLNRSISVVFIQGLCIFLAFPVQKHYLYPGYTQNLTDLLKGYLFMTLFLISFSNSLHLSRLFSQNKFTIFSYDFLFLKLGFCLCINHLRGGNICSRFSFL